jgi:prepilin-type N-terminal cleavage/methylation domain-containing protein
MRESQRAFTLIETLVACAIVATLLLAGGFWMMGLHPGALAQAATDYDAAMSGARALAAASSNGATLVFAPISGRSGFALRVYGGRPSGSNAVQPTTTMPVTSDATVSEKTLGAPPFAIFVGASGHVSGKASYPTVDASGNATFTTIATEPACPAGGFVLTFSAPSGATATRTLACTSTAASAPGFPNPSPTPNVPIVTPPALVYHWPADARQTFVATEWGYTHWFATAGGFACGTGVASFPNVLPSPYSPAYTPAEAQATPSPPPGTPYSYPNSATSMNDAPAAFPLDPAAAGLCTATVTDEYGQRAHTNVQVMGWLSAAYGGKTYTHLSAPAMSLPSSDFPNAGSAVTIPLSKIYDSEALVPAVSLDAACSPYVKATATGGTTPSAPSSTAATATVTLSLATMPGSKIDCSGVLFDQYPGSLGGEGITFNATLGNPEIDLWPAITEYPLLGFDIENASGPVCSKNQPRALNASQNAIAGASPPSGFPQTFSTDSNGCIQYDGSAVKQNGSGWAGVSTLVYEAGYSGSFIFAGPNSTKLAAKYGTACSTLAYNANLYSNTGPSAGVQGSALSTTDTCGYGVESSDVTTVGNMNTEGVDIVARSCETSGTTVYVPPGGSCSLALPADNGGDPCNSGTGGQQGKSDTYYPTFAPLGANTLIDPGQDNSKNGWTISPLTEDATSYSITAGASVSGPVTVYIIDVHGSAEQTRSGNCFAKWTWEPSGTLGSYE